MNKALRILVVDDDKDNANSLAEIFELEGHTVVRAHSGKDAVTAFRSRNFDVAFMDIAMPEKNGLQRGGPCRASAEAGGIGSASQAVRSEQGALHRAVGNPARRDRSDRG